MQAFRIKYYGDEDDGPRQVIRVGHDAEQAKRRLRAERRGRGCRIAKVEPVDMPPPDPAFFGEA